MAVTKQQIWTTYEKNMRILTDEITDIRDREVQAREITAEELNISRTAVDEALDR